MKKGADADYTELKIGSYKLLTDSGKLLARYQNYLTKHTSDLYLDTLQDHVHSYFF